VTAAYRDGSANKEQTLAGFDIHFPELSPQLAMRNISSRIPGFQFSAQAEAYGILTSLMLARQDLSLSIYSDCESLVNTINTYMHRTPLYYEIQYFQGVVARSDVPLCGRARRNAIYRFMVNFLRRFYR
jgi:hypothetical protein